MAGEGVLVPQAQKLSNLETGSNQAESRGRELFSWVLWGLHCIIMIDWVIVHWLIGWVNLQPLCPVPSRGWELGAESSHPLIIWLVHLATSPYLWVRSRSLLINIIRHPLYLHGTEAFSGTVNQDQIYLKKYILVIWMTIHICISYKSLYHSWSSGQQLTFKRLRGKMLFVLEKLL